MGTEHFLFEFLRRQWEVEIFEVKSTGLSWRKMQPKIKFCWWKLYDLVLWTFEWARKSCLSLSQSYVLLHVRGVMIFTSNLRWVLERLNRLHQNSCDSSTFRIVLKSDPLLGDDRRHQPTLPMDLISSSVLNILDVTMILWLCLYLFI